ncbi:hypothetical protein [Silanimonas sp.]|uniref:hypothetical protein n=1 Tax=Silanimonas sp. TaxID=1929290 RepID=UPI0037C85A93
MAASSLGSGLGVTWSPLQRRVLEALGHAPVQRRSASAGMAEPLAAMALPPRLRGGLERWVGALWAEWPSPQGRPGDAAFKRALWRRVRDWRRGG